MYSQEKISEHIYRIIEQGDVCFYLVVGEKKACLLDTGWGTGNVRKLTESLTKLPVEVILTHGHCDHVGGSGFFQRVWMNEADIALFEVHSERKFREESFIREGGMCTAELAPVYRGSFLPAVDGQIFDLGGLHVRLFAVPGHTRGMLCPLILEERTIVLGDACGEGVLLWDQYSSTVSVYKNSLESLKQHADQFDINLRNHGTFSSGPELIDNVLDCCNLILAGNDDKQEVYFWGKSLYSAKMIDGSSGMRLDGKHGNIIYAADKAK